MDTKPGPKPITTTFGFLDEVGLLHSPKEDRIFGLGLLRLLHPSELHKEMQRYKNKMRFHQEFKFNMVSNGNLKYYKGLLDLYFSVRLTKFSCIIFDKSGLDLNKYFKNDYYKAYNSFTAKLIAGSIDTSEYIVVLADDVSTPKSDNFEKDVKDKIKQKARRNALFGICRVESHAVSEIQIVDVLLGIVAYAFKVKYKLVITGRRNAKLRLVKYLQKLLNTDELSEAKDYSLRFGRKFSIKEFKGSLDNKK